MRHRASSSQAVSSSSFVTLAQIALSQGVKRPVTRSVSALLSCQYRVTTRRGWKCATGLIKRRHWHAGAFEARDLRRVRCARHALLSGALGDVDYDSPRTARKKSKGAAYAATRMVRLTPEAQLLKPLAVRILDYARSRPEGPHIFATILSDMTQRLAVMDRYERRALSRRKFAIRAFDAARRQAASARE